MDYKKQLTENILPFWMNNAIDKENGGIFTCLDETGNIYGREKSVWFQGRALWTFSKAYNIIEQKKEYLDAAETIYKFLPKCTDSDGRMFFTVTADGKELQKRRYYFSETFAAIGCAEYYKATLDEDIAKEAEKYFDVAYECYTGVRKNNPKFNPQNQNLKALSPVMIMLSTAQVMSSMNNQNREKYLKIASDCTNEILYGGYLTDKALMENVTANGEFANTPTGRIVNPGHSLEAAWFLMMEGITNNCPKAIHAGKQIIDLTLPIGIDKNHGGVIAFCDISGQPPVQLEWDMKLWWPQCEAIIALKLAYILFGEEKYKPACNLLELYCQEHFIDNKNGEWYGYLHYDNTVSTTLKGNIFKGPFHIPRMYMVMSVLEESGDISKYVN